jgi:nucleoside-diphosphate-sugar epimerase
MMSPEAILVTGATGCVGPRVVQVLHAAGCRVRALSHSAPLPGVLPAGVELVACDVTDRVAVRAAMEGMTAVIHLAALLHISDPRPGMLKEYQRINVDGTAAVVEASLQAGAKRIVYFSTIAVYDDSKGQVLTENSETRPSSWYAQTKLEAERIVLGTSGSNPRLDGTVLRCGAIYGTRMKGNYRQLIRALDRKRFVPVGNGANRRTLIYDKDAARAALLALRHPAAIGEIFNLSDGQFHTMSEILSTLCLALGRRPPGFALPWKPVHEVAGILDAACSLAGRRSAFRARLGKYSEDIAVSSSRIRDKLGFAPEFTMEAGWREAIGEMREMRLL